ncbi:MAG: hypothetical protein RL386_305 [Bacteroidota bacterium]|jgi:hypothetical protein
MLRLNGWDSCSRMVGGEDGRPLMKLMKGLS